MQLFINKAICFRPSGDHQMLNYEKKVNQWVFIKNFILTDILLEKDLRKKGLEWTYRLLQITPPQMQNVQFLAFLYNYCAKSQIKLTFVCLSYFFALCSLMFSRT